MAKAIAIVVVDLERSRLGGSSHAGDGLAGMAVLARTVQRVARTAQVREAVVLCPSGQESAVAALLKSQPDVPVCSFGFESGLDDDCSPMRRVARKWGMGSWRGGLSGATCYDELLGGKAIAAAMQSRQADAAVLVGGDWALVDGELCSGVLELHLRHPQAMPMVFNQAPPGLSAVAVGRELIEQFAQTPGSSFGALMAYNPRRPQADAIGKDFCVQVPPEVRDCGRRFIYDVGCARMLVSAVAKELGESVAEANAAAVASAVRRIDARCGGELAGLPREITLELTARRLVDGPLAPQRSVTLGRGDMPIPTALRIIEQCDAQNTLLTLGGLGDPLLHEGWAEVVAAAAAAGVLSVAVETDLFVAREGLAKLLDLPVEVVSVRLNADTAATYRQLMGTDRFDEVRANMAWLLSERNRRAAEGKGRIGVPWIVPRMIKTRQSLGEMESFFDRWTHFTGCAVIDGPTPGRGRSGNLAPDLSLVQMASPRRRPCRQLARRVTIHSDGRAALCDQDWLAEAAVGAADTGLTQVLANLAERRAAHLAGRWDELALCAGCREWHRP